ncbi:MADS-box protein FLOWERING LOCUS C isoform X2 [Lactuca sativa]|uniref:MADS-box protein FLOWERING LOCUS C isoform X2 n=1 Tax=Lactuca sativa TaxID=4236 RepID=UPI001C688F25|nr:MADS-box protein FLOWERING LOCUS C isoform X2 [Lactuca sativa]
MGRRKLEIKRIQDKSSRLVTFSKRRTGLFKKARHLSVICDVDVAAFVISDSGKLYEFCSGGYNSNRYQAEERTTQEGAFEDMAFNKSTRFRTCKELLKSVRRVDEQPNEVSVSDMTKLEEELHAALLHTRSKKTQLMVERMSTFHEQVRKLTEEKEELKQQLQVASAKKNQKDDVDDDGGEGLDHSANSHSYYQTNLYPPQPLLTLPLFKE